MTVKNNWISSSLDQRTSENLCDFSITINPYNFIKDSFLNNAKRVAIELSSQHNNLYVLYSGGLDSEFVLKLFIENNLPITPVTLVTPFNKNELAYAVKFYKKYNIKPFIINYTDTDLLINKARSICRQKGWFSFLGAIYYDILETISLKNGIVINGNGEPFFTGQNEINQNKIVFNEWEFYERYTSTNHIGGFFTYDLALHHSMITEVNLSNDINISKSKLYNLEYRKKLVWDRSFFDLIDNIPNNVKKYKVVIPYADYVQSLSDTKLITFQ